MRCGGQPDGQARDAARIADGLAAGTRVEGLGTSGVPRMDVDSLCARFATPRSQLPFRRALTSTTA
jgi:hypothetical protein